VEVFSTVVQALTAGAIIFAAWQLMFHSRQTHREFELLYVQRYWDLMDRRSEQMALNGAPQPSDRTVVHAYLQLSEDELDLRRLGSVTDSTWTFWGTAITDQAGSSLYLAELNSSDPNAYPRVRVHLNGGGDPLEHNWLWRKVHGL